MHLFQNHLLTEKTKNDTSGALQYYLTDPRDHKVYIVPRGNLKHLLVTLWIRVFQIYFSNLSDYFQNNVFLLKVIFSKEL